MKAENIMVRHARTALLATAALVLSQGAALAGSAESYGSGVVSPAPYVAPVQTIVEPAPYYAPTPIAVEPVRGGNYDDGRGSNDDFGYSQSSACGGVLDGEKCLVILNDHMRRVRLDRDAGTILVGNPTIADVTVLGNDTMFVSARSIGSTNIIALDEDGEEIVTFEVFVREPRTKRVVLRNAGLAENYQCAPQCERALSQADSPTAYSAASGIVSGDIGLDQQSIGLQSGVNPNTQPQAIQPRQQQAPAPAGGQTGGIGGAVQSLNQQIAPVANTAQAVSAMLTGGGSEVQAPVRSDAPPMPN